MRPSSAAGLARVRFAARATASLDEQVAFRRARNPHSAERLLDEVARAVLLLSEHPLAGPRVQGRAAIRHAITRRYRFRLIYRVEGDEVLILDVLHPGRAGP